MFRRIFSFILHSRLENVMAVGVSTVLLALFWATHAIHTFTVGMLNLIFILLPVGILGVKILLETLLSSPTEAEESTDPAKYLVQFFKPLLKIFRDWFPFFLLSACYYSLYSNLIMQVNPHVIDPLLARIDAAMFGGQVAVMLEPWIHPWITETLSVVYFSHVVVFPGVALYFYIKKEDEIFRRLMMGYLTIMLMGTTSYLIFPATGPENFLAHSFTRGLDGKALSHGVAFVISIGRVTYDCFPSLHVGIPLLVALYLRNYRRKIFAPALVYVGLMCCATIYLRYHYVIDVLGAFVFAPAAYFLNNFLLRIWPGERILAAPAQADAKSSEPLACSTN